MQKIVFADKTEFEILEGASLGNITVYVMISLLLVILQQL